MEVSHDLVGRVPSSWVTTQLGLVSIDLMELMAFEVSVLIPIPIPIPMPRFQCRGLQMAIKKHSLEEHRGKQPTQTVD